MIDLSQVIWRKSSQSNANGGQCVEVGVWRKSSLSGGNGGSCVEVALASSAQAETDTKQIPTVSSWSVTPRTPAARCWPSLLPSGMPSS